MLDGPAIVLLPPLGFSPSGQAFNLAADDVAEHVAVQLQAAKLIAFDAAPCLAHGDGRRLSHLTPAGLDAALAAASPAPATKQHLAMLARAVRGGVASGQLVSHQDDGALLAELFTADGVGTQVTEDDRHPRAPSGTKGRGGHRGDDPSSGGVRCVGEAPQRPA